MGKEMSLTLYLALMVLAAVLVSVNPTLFGVMTPESMNLWW